MRIKRDPFIAEPLRVCLEDVVVVESLGAHAERELVAGRSLSRVPEWGLHSDAIRQRLGWDRCGCLGLKTNGQQHYEDDKRNGCTQLFFQGTTLVAALELHVLAQAAILNDLLVVKSQKAL